jgi:hypothetical protein
VNTLLVAKSVTSSALNCLPWFKTRPLSAIKYAKADNTLRQNIQGRVALSSIHSEPETTEVPEGLPHVIVESRPKKIVAALYDDLPFPNIGSMQEVVFDIGITAYNATVSVSGMVFKGYSGHQMLFEERWPARLILARTKQPDLRIESETGLAIRSIHFMRQGYELLTSIEVTVVAKYEDDGQTTQSVVNIPVEFHTQQTDLHFPLEGAWWAIQAGDWSDRHKQEVYSQPYALDFVKLGPNNLQYSGDGLKLEDHYSWNQPVYATAGGKVAYVAYDMPDLQPGVPPDPRLFRDDVRRLLGNAVAISHANGEFSYYGHLQQLSIQVNQGQMIKRGTLLGYVGNSGNSPGPHLHFHLMEGPNIFIDRGLPARFSHFWAGGQFFERPTFIPTRMIVVGPNRITPDESE